MNLSWIATIARRYPGSPEPILLPKVRIEFADFPYLHLALTGGY